VKVYELNFRGAKLIGVKHEGRIVIPIAPICAAMTIGWEQQRQRIRRDPVLSKGAIIIMVPFTGGGPQHLVCLPLNRLHFWLAGIESSRIKDDAIRSCVIEYQEECADALFAYFMPGYAALIGVKLPTLEARLLHEDLFDRDDAELQPTPIPENVIPFPSAELARREDALRAAQCAEEASRQAALAREAALGAQKSIVWVQNQKRRDPTQEACDCGRDIVWNSYRGLCPCCQENVIMTKPDRMIPRIPWDHAIHPHKNGPFQGWYVCIDCNEKFEKDQDDSFRSEKGPAWNNYLGHVKRYFRLNKKLL
jgi:hypothetical protein